MQYVQTHTLILIKCLIQIKAFYVLCATVPRSSFSQSQTSVARNVGFINQL